MVKLAPGKIEKILDADMTSFTLINWTLDYCSSADEGCVEMKVKLKRKAKGEILTTYFPTLLLTAIAFATSFFKPFFFEAALSVNLTTMLVMTTIFISKMEGLPPTSATKMIDYWLILCQLVPFAQVVLLTAMEYLREEDEEKESLGRRVQKSPDQKSKRLGHWKLAKEKRSKVAYVSMLMVVGKIYFF